MFTHIYEVKRLQGSSYSHLCVFMFLCYIIYGFIRSKNNYGHHWG